MKRATTRERHQPKPRKRRSRALFVPEKMQRTPPEPMQARRISIVVLLFDSLVPPTRNGLQSEA